MRHLSALAALMLLIPAPAGAADPIGGSFADRAPVVRQHVVMKGRATPIDGTSLWFPTYGRSVRLAGIDGCELPQWAFDPKRAGDASTGALAPVPCGALAKAWLKRTVGSGSVTCDIRGFGADAMPVGTCRSGSRDLAHEMLRVGWARLSPDAPRQPAYVDAQRYAVSARYGIWGTYVLDMNEWRAKAVDRTLDRRPAADINLLRERKVEFTPPFADARRAPVRRDR
ncbi:endonuclease YncB(thermonuclease family) [Rhizobium petrolearium]|uniref:Thermonuclease family protein n=2 Tax=Neorhizobium TaxID=1525371 RepID=A0ABV0MEA1_9HYPH|nr:thermonuclease family protein [Neorhizobium petrolearium]MBP1848298.1 endonuclease YncB(thermonuclease family) [Neorhizobium petrolearium]MCC2614454.1 thermonuclease family protein [Neorhizobium petrolearium]WGI72220.1 thermonuclease family protein [Neorhizobium petrolearium]